jgi:cation transport ATPase
MKRSNHPAENPLTEQLVLFCAALALVLLIVAWVLSGNALMRFILSVLSFLVSLFALKDELLAAIREKDLGSGLILLIVSGIICICTGTAVYAALAMLIRLLAGLVLPRLRAGVLRLLDTRRELNPLKESLPAVQTKTILVHPHEQLLKNYLTYLMVLLAALVAILSVLLSELSVADALSRAAVILALGGTFPLFAAFPLSDYAAVLCAGESGVLFRRDTITRLMGLKLACVKTQEPVDVGTAAVFPARPEAVGPELMLRLAATACADTELDAAEKLAAVSKNTSSADIERKVLPGLGVVARVKDITVLAGSAEFMKRSGLSVLPFPENAQVLHMGVNGHYVGCIDFSESQQAEDCEKALDSAGFFRFKDALEASEKRLPGEKLLYVRPASEHLSGQKDDLSAAAGVLDRFDQITMERAGRAGVAALMEQLGCARLGRKGILLVALIVKAFLFLLTVFGICPLWLAVLLETAAVAFTYRYCVRLLDYLSKY